MYIIVSRKSPQKLRHLALKRVFWVKVICICLLVLGLGSWVYMPVAFADIPKYITFQGKLTDASGTPVADGTYSVTFRLYAAETGGAALWTEKQTVTVANGIFTVSLGTVTAIDIAFDVEYWLSVQVGSDTEMSPRQRLTSAGYAINADKLDTYSSGQFLRSDASDTATGQLTLSYPGTALVLQPSSAPAADTKLIDVQDTSGASKFIIDYEGDLGSQNATVAGTLGVTGATTLSNTLGVTGVTTLSGATNIDGSLAVGTNALTVDATTGYVGIGTTEPTKALHIVGDADILGDLAIGTVAAPKDITVRGDLNIAGDQTIEGSTIYAGDLTVSGDVDVDGITYLDELQLNDNEKIKLGSSQDVELYVDANDDLYIANVQQDKDMHFQVNDGGTTTTALFIDADTSRIGIGLTNPSAQLEIATPGGNSIEFDTSNPNYVILKVNGEEVVRIIP